MALSNASLSLSYSDSLANALPPRIWYLGTPLLVALATAGASIVGPAWLPLSLFGTILGFALAVMLNRPHRVQVPIDGARIIETPFLLSHDRRVFDLYRRVASALLRVSQQSDLILRDLALERILQSANELEQLAAGNITFADTETWRLAYERLLRSPGTYRYRSVALIRTEKYWGEEPGRRSIRLNQELASAGTVAIERIVIIADDLWPKDSLVPTKPIRLWLEEQHTNAIKLRVVRLSAITSEPDLVADCGIYGSRAVGVQEIDADGRTARFTLAFDFDQVLAAEEKWERLSVYATAFDDLLC